MFITSVSLFSIWQTVDTLDFCWLALFLALSAKTCFYEQNSHPEKTIPAITPPCNLDSFAEKCFHLRKTTWSWGNCTKSSLVFWKTKRKIGAIACSGDVWGVLACKSHRFAEMSKELKEEAIIQCNCQHFSPLEHIYDDNAWIAWVSILIIMMIIIMAAAIIQCDCQHFLPKDAHTMNSLF